MRNPKFDSGFIDLRNFLVIEGSDTKLTEEEFQKWEAEWEADMQELEEFYKAREEWEREWWKARETPDD